MARVLPFTGSRAPGGFNASDLRSMVRAGLLFGLLWNAFDRPAAADTRIAHEPIRPTVRVVDGDTFWIGGDKIRIADIDTPETHPPRCAEEAELGERATRRLTVLLSQGPFELHPIAGRDADRYGRKLRIVTRNGRSVGDMLVAEGLARTWTGRREPWCV